MQITLYKCSAPPNVVNKDPYFISDAKTVTGEWYESSSILTPVFRLKRDDTLLDYNYCKIPKFSNRYYYVNNIESDNPYLILYMQVDELETYKADILNSTQIIGRCADQRGFNLYLKDDMMPLEEEPQYDTVVWNDSPSPFKTNYDTTDTLDNLYCITLVTSGKLLNQS